MAKDAGDSPSSSEFDDLLRACHDISGLFPQGVVFIGGIAVYLHAINNPAARPFAEFTHDADFYISLSDMSDLRDIEELTPNRRLNKHQLRKRGFEFDIYTERHAALIVPYDQVVAHSTVYDPVRVACLEHLLVLKIEAFRDRGSSTKGQKDAKDIIRIATIARSHAARFNFERAVAYLSEIHLDLIERISLGPEFMSLAKGNSKSAKELRVQFAKFAKNLGVSQLV
jgi:hypothetical protein